MTNEALEVVLENLIDRHEIDVVLEKIAEVCFLKAEHLNSAWDDASGAHQWIKLARKLNKIRL